MKILLIGNYQPDSIESMNRFASMLEIYLNQFGHQVRVIHPIPHFGRLNLPSQLFKKWLGYIDKLILFPSQLREALSWADVIHICDHGNAVYTKYLRNIPHVVTCHDLLAIRSALGEFTEFKTKWTGKQIQQMILKGLDQAQKIVCVSEQTRSDLLRLSSLSESAVSLIPMGLNYPYRPMATTEAKQRLKYLGIPQDSQFILHVGGNYWYKNRLGVLAIFDKLMLKLQHPDFYLVMVGKPMTVEMRQLITVRNLTHKVIDLVNVDNESLRSLYSSATALLFPSLYEGFGWPIIEAQACGCPVFTSNRPPMNEVGGEAAIYIEADNPEIAAEKIVSYLPRLEEFKLQGFVNYQKFTAEGMIEKYIEIYRQAIDDRSTDKV
ncbi:MAG: glycosyltransferase family 4 protein [Pelatocladus maniniholoensis HA4357-MV3]|jgi:glycosyltransferase involved in cell wall biosynthesis|uniref:Glycosyltransferase family 4 protein n=1 Tax=Pelatocladus maniniholoensis HA4357-MV3 TaxID=1117104 RepID=A0A9E3LTP6_9NOST|nr:glycosyltransferase family 4 protein [Pelatocladus maniniholoensis HA4357-MV3]BAZ68257.1 putative glycosyl transferase [Fischerella sp. NIES-4106]